ncbi:GlsB/YeaQ/YmgE family stress response membrane protein [Polaromonas aquatica]|uniref:GlsB/YeaQ/YmgE family stress response membrane protein n=1 Tax=Polaromonas aquatica TaxID=332657 RepID=UPI003D64E8B2
MTILWTILIGFLIGLVAKFLMPGRDPGGFIITVLIGIAGSFIATYLGMAMGWYQQGETAGFIAAVLGSIVLLLGYRMIAKR